MSEGLYFLLCMYIGYRSYQNGWQVGPIFLVSIFLTPIAGFVMLSIRGKKFDQ